MTKHTILFLAANPVGTDRLALDEEARAIHEELARTGHRDEFELTTRWAVRPLDLLRELRKLKPTVVHFSGHGGCCDRRSVGGPRREVVGALGGMHGEAVGRNAARGLFFQGDGGQPQIVSAEALEETFGAAGISVKLVVLNACYSDAQAKALLAKVDCVVGMPGSVRDDTARIFAIGLYGGLGERASVVGAYRQGCAAIGLEGLSDGNRPLLKVRQGVNANALILAAGHDTPQRSAVKSSDCKPTTTAPEAEHKGKVGGRRSNVRALIAFASLVCALGSYLVTSRAQQFDITVFLHGEAGPQAPALRNHGKLSLDLRADRRTESVGDKGEVRFVGIPANLRGSEVALVLDADEYELSNPGRGIRLDQEVFYVAVRPKQVRLAGYILDDEGRPLPQARAGIAGTVATTSQEGRFEMMLPADLSDDDRMITITATGYETWRGRVALGGNPLQVRLSAADTRR